MKAANIFRAIVLLLLLTARVPAFLWAASPVTSLDSVLGAWRQVEGEGEVTLVVERERLLNRTVHAKVGYVSALPQIEKDVRAGKLDGQPYALLYDRLQLRLGGMQRYGSQVHRGDRGPYVPGLEEPEEVDERREELGMVPLAEYLEILSETFFDGVPVRIGKD